MGRPEGVIVAGTGHRPHKLRVGSLDGYAPSVDALLVQFAERCVRRLAPTLVISGMALGWDTALAEAAVRAGVPFDAYVPFEGQESRWPPSSQARYHRLLGQARRVVIVSAGRYAGWKLQRRNEAMVDAATFMLVLWDGSPGGTGNCMNYIYHTGRKYANVWDHWLRHAQS